MRRASKPPVASPRQAPARAWQRMLSGRRLDLLDPSPLDVEIADIAHGLARVARWNGQTHGDHAFSVAQHSLIVESIVAATEPDPRWRLAALLHDAPEYVIGDMISPFKTVLGGDYHAVEDRLMTAVLVRFSLPALVPAAIRKLIKSADRASAFHEAVELANFSREEALAFFGAPVWHPPQPGTLDPWPAPVAQAAFLERFAALDHAVAKAPAAPSPEAADSAPTARAAASPT